MAGKKDNGFGYISHDGISAREYGTKTDLSGTALPKHVSPAAETHSDMHAKIELTDLMPNTKFDVPAIKPASNLDVNKAVTVKPEDTSHLRQEVDNVAEAYMDANQACMDTIADAICEVDPDHGQAVVNNVFPAPSSSSPVSAVASVMDPTGIAGNAYAVINQVMSQSRKPDDAKVQEILTKALSELHKMNDPVQQGQKTSAAPPKPNPHGFDFTAIKSAKQLENFIQRDPMEDKVMQEIEAAHQGLDVMDENKERFENHYADNITGEKIIAAVERGGSNVAELTGGLTAAEIQMDSDFIGSLKGPVKTKPKDLADLDENTKAAMPALGLEFDPRKLGFAPSVAPPQSM